VLLDVIVENLPGHTVAGHQRMQCQCLERCSVRPRHRRLDRWLHRLGGKLGLSSDRDGPYILLAGIRAVLVTVATMSFAAQHPFPRAGETCG